MQSFCLLLLNDSFILIIRFSNPLQRPRNATLSIKTPSETLPWNVKRELWWVFQWEFSWKADSFFKKILNFSTRSHSERLEIIRKHLWKYFQKLLYLSLLLDYWNMQKKNSLRERWAQSYSSMVNELWTYCTYLFQWCAPAKRVSGEYWIVQYVHCTIRQDILYCIHNELKLIRVKREVKETNGVRENDIFKGAGWKTESKSIS